MFSLVAVLAFAVPAFAQGTAGLVPAIDLTRYFGIGLTVIGASYGISRLASSALESMARQPEIASSIQTAMIIAAALIEGFTFFALVLCMS
ncbi:MAG: ATP synthase F0 subunit C [Blastopirellula sp.]|nr:MAG: ATP synthase F0 subunit C [Blastopirellula sp.]